MIDKMRSDFEAFKTRYGGGFLNDAADDSDKLLHTVAWDAWQAATMAERERQSSEATGVHGLVVPVAPKDTP